jgi:hypothetical protein
MATEKIVNYTAEQTAELVEAYKATPTNETVTAFATKFGKTAKSIVAKLAREGVYKGKAKEAGKRDMLKSEMVAEIAKLTGKTDEQLESLEKATGPALKAVLAAMTNMAETIVQLKVEALKAETQPA